jgi:hypothetical protein
MERRVRSSSLHDDDADAAATFLMGSKACSVGLFNRLGAWLNERACQEKTSAVSAQAMSNLIVFSAGCPHLYQNSDSCRV